MYSHTKSETTSFVWYILLVVGEDNAISNIKALHGEVSINAAKTPLN